MRIIMYVAEVIVAILLYVRGGNAFDEMYIEGSEVSYKENLEAATKFHIYDYDRGAEILGFELHDIRFDNIAGKAQYDVAMFRGIKYATAERFARPVPMELPTEHPVEALRSGPSCPQPSQDYFDHPVNYTEDCLYLDIYVPLRRTVVAYRDQSAEWTSRERYTRYDDLPIVIAFQGEDFTYVESRTVDGRVLARYGSVIVAVVNYRTGILGFLNSGNDEIKGNFGLADQKTAIEWVKSNAKKFGGDPSSITLLGYSSGAESVSVQMHDPRNSKHLFQRVILQSGITRINSQFSNNITEELKVQNFLYMKILEYLECSANDSVRCLQSAAIEDLITAAGLLTYERGNNRTFGPVAEDKHSCDLVDLGQYSAMIGMVEFEAGDIAEDLPKEESISEGIQRILSYYKVFKNASDSLVKYLTMEYSSFPEVSPADRTGYGFVKAASDFDYVVPAMSFAKKLSYLGGTNYVYRFSPQVKNLQPGKPYFIEDRAVHGEDQKYMFGLPLLLVQLFTDSDRNISANYIRMISNFAHSGDPNTGPTGRPNSLPLWIPFDVINSGTYEIAAKMEMKYNVFAKTMAIWTEAVPHLIENDLCKVQQETQTSSETETPPEKIACPRSCKCKSSWEASYREWKNVNLPAWKEKFQKASKDLDEKNKCNR